MSEKQKKSWSYGRLTTDQPDDNMSMSLNLFFAKDGEAWARNCGPEPEFGDIKLTDFIRLAAKTMNILDLALPVNDRALDELMADLVADGPEEPEGLLAIVHTAGWAFAELRERLKAYEDTGLTPEEVDALKAERDAAVAVAGLYGECRTCKNDIDGYVSEKCDYCVNLGGDRKNWEWRGSGGK